MGVMRFFQMIRSNPQWAKPQGIEVKFAIKGKQVIWLLKFTINVLVCASECNYVITMGFIILYSLLKGGECNLPLNKLVEWDQTGLDLQRNNSDY